jgi:hypothetical protein
MSEQKLLTTSLVELSVERTLTPEEALRAAIYNELEGTTVACFALEQSWTRLGVKLAEFKAKECWRPLGYENLDAFMNELRHRFQRGRTQLWGYLSVAEQLLPTIGAARLEQMGISKALVLKRALKKLNGQPMPQELIDSALDSTKTTKELRGDIGKALNLGEEQKGTWFDLDGFFMDATERAEFKEAFLATEGILQLKNTLPDHIRRKCVIMAWLQEFYGTHAAEFYGSADAVPLRMRASDVAGNTDEERTCEGNLSSLHTGPQSGTPSCEAVLIVRAPTTAVQRVSEGISEDEESFSRNTCPREEKSQEEL